MNTAIPLLVKRGNVHGGQQAVSGSTIQLYAVGTTGDGSPATPLLTQPVMTDSSGDFNITNDYSCPSATSLVYIVATGGNPGLAEGTNNTALAMMAALGPCGNLTASTVIMVNELTTVAAVWPLAPFMSSYSSVGSGSSDATVLAAAFTLAADYANISTGTIPGLNVPAGTTVPIAQINTIADILSICVNSPGGAAGDGSTCGMLLSAATPSGGTSPVNVIGAGLNIANNPTANISNLFALVAGAAAYQPTLTAAPADWTVGLAAPTGLSVSATAITFPAAYINFSPTQTLTVTNNGATPVSVTSLFITGAAAADFTVSSSSCPASPGLPAGATCEEQVTFTPSTVGPRNASLAIESSAVNSTITIPLTGAGLALSGGSVTLSPSLLTFSLAGIPQPVTVTNNGTTPVEIGSISVTTTGNVVSGFAETNKCGSTLAAQSICTVSVQTGSLTVSGFAGTLTVIDSAASGTQTLPLSAPASVNFSASPLAFGSWALGVTSPDQTAGANSGSYYNSAPPVFISITGPNASDFAYSFPSVSPGCGSNYECYVDITFTPGGLGARTATLVTNYGNIALSGSGIPDGPSFTIASYSGPEETVGSSSPPTLLAVVNNGYTPLVLSGISVTGSSASDFAVTNQCNSTLSTAASCNLSIVFTPSQVGLRKATLTVTDATSGVSNAIPLTGTGDPMAPMVTPNLLTFGNTEVGAVSTVQSATISAPNGDPVAITYIGSDPLNSFLVSPATCATQTPCQVSVSFQPSSTGRLYSLYQVTDNVTSKFTDLTLLGTGGVATVSLSATSLTFAARDEGTTSIPQMVALTNTGDASLTISLVSFIGANTWDFSIQSNTCGSSVASGANCAISISFSPTASGSRNATLQIMSNAASSPDTVQLLGTGN